MRRDFKVFERQLAEHIGARLRQKRLELGFNQTQMLQDLGLTYQILQKYERGTVRIPIAVLLHLSEYLKVSLTYFFEEGPSLSTKLSSS